MSIFFAGALASKVNLVRKIAETPKAYGSTVPVAEIATMLSDARRFIREHRVAIAFLTGLITGQISHEWRDVLRARVVEWTGVFAQFVTAEDVANVHDGDTTDTDADDPTP